MILFKFLWMKMIISYHFRSRKHNLLFCQLMTESDLILLFSRNNEKWYRGMMQNFFCNTSHYYIFQPFPAVRSNNNNICLDRKSTRLNSSHANLVCRLLLA